MNVHIEQAKNHERADRITFKVFETQLDNGNTLTAIWCGIPETEWEEELEDGQFFIEEFKCNWHCLSENQKQLLRQFYEATQFE